MEWSHSARALQLRGKGQSFGRAGQPFCLKRTIGAEQGEKHSFDEPLDDVTIAYHRDRNEPGPDIEHYQALGDLGYAFGKICNEAYAYIFVESEGLWYGMKCPWGDEPAEYQLLQDILDELENT